jgi:hypothetical protein
VSLKGVLLMIFGARMKLPSGSPKRQAMFLGGRDEPKRASTSSRRPRSARQDCLIGLLDMFSILWKTRKTLVVLYCVAVAIALLLVLWPGHLREAGLFILGGLLTIGTTTFLEDVNRTLKAQDVVRPIHAEFANRVARCCFDFENPWSKYYKNPSMGGLDAERIRKFSPDPPIIYPATAAQFGLLPQEAPEALVEFYTRLVGLQRAIDEAATDPGNTKYIEAVARRMRHTLRPGLDGLKTLGSVVRRPDATENAAYANLGEALGMAAPKLSLRASIEKLLREHPAKM